MKTRAAVETLLGVAAKLPPSLQPRQEPDTGRARCVRCVTGQQGVGYKKSRHTNVNKVKQRCFRCTRPVCGKQQEGWTRVQYLRGRSNPVRVKFW